MFQQAKTNKKKLNDDDIICYEEVKKKEQDKLDEKKEKKNTKKKMKNTNTNGYKSRIVKTLCVPNGGMGVALRRLHRALFIT
jgi:hypothetical protein